MVNVERSLCDDKSMLALLAEEFTTGAEAFSQMALQMNGRVSEIGEDIRETR